MKCPNCLTTMECITEIHNVPWQPGRQRMDLHCIKPIPIGGRGCNIRCHMGVITEDPKPWMCHEYGFSFDHEGYRYILSSFDQSIDVYHQGLRLPNTILEQGDKVLYRLPYFIPLSTDNDMHERAWELFHKLRKLVIFS